MTLVLVDNSSLYSQLRSRDLTDIGTSTDLFLGTLTAHHDHRLLAAQSTCKVKEHSTCAEFVLVFRTALAERRLLA